MARGNTGGKEKTDVQLHENLGNCCRLEAAGRKKLSNIIYTSTKQKAQQFSQSATHSAWHPIRKTQLTYE